MKWLQSIAILLLSVLLVACSGGIPASESAIALDNRPEYSLDWKIGEGQIIAYRTALNQVQDEDSQITIDWGQLLDEEVDMDAAEFIEKIVFPEQPTSTSLISVLERNEVGNITVKMILDDVVTSEAAPDDMLGTSFNQMLERMEGTVQLRGELRPEGTIASFYLENRQKNLLAIFFELPEGPVKVGDTWQIEVNCISMGAGFVVTNANKLHEVTLSEITQTLDGRPLAVLDYVIIEVVSGVMDSALSDEQIGVSMSCSYLARGYFLINEGRWHALGGEFAVKSDGIMSGNSIQQIGLVPLETLPESYIEMD